MQATRRALSAGFIVALLELLARPEALLSGAGWGWSAIGVVGWVVLFAALVGGLTDALLRDRWWPTRGTPIWLLAALAGWTLSVGVHPSTYPKLHLALDAGLVVAIGLLLPPLPKKAALGALLAAALAASTLVFIAPHPGLTAIRQSGLTSRRILRVTDRALDWDGDGFAPSWWLAGADCDNGDARVGPHMPELQGNGVDDNCIGGDLPKQTRGTPPLGPKRARNLVMVTLCTFRDAPIGNERPALFDLRAHTRWALRNRSQAPQSGQSFRSALTSRPPIEIDTDAAMLPRLRGEGPPAMLLDKAKAAGFRTAFANHGFARALLWLKHAPFDAHFPGEDRVQAALDWLAASEQPAILWFHLNYPHTKPNDLRPNHFAHGSRIDYYRRNVKRVEAEIGRLFAGLAPHWHDTAFALFADHGEAFGEGGYYFHGYTPHEAKIRTPFMMRWPGVEPGPMLRNTGNIDFLPTTLELLGLPPAADALGRSWLLPEVARPIISEVVHKRQLRSRTVVDATGRWKLWLGLQPAFRALYDLSTDPDERFDVAAEHPEVVAELERVGDTFYTR